MIFIFMYHVLIALMQIEHDENLFDISICVFCAFSIIDFLGSTSHLIFIYIHVIDLFCHMLYIWSSLSRIRLSFDI
jgi:hypothetical protein